MPSTGDYDPFFQGMIPFDMKASYFEFDDGEWMDNALEHAIRVAADKHSLGQSYRGQISCLQIYTDALTPAQIAFLKNCSFDAKEYQSSKCPADYTFFDGHCYKVLKLIILIT